MLLCVSREGGSLMSERESRILRDLKQLIIERFELDIGAQALDHDTILIGEGLALDSIAVLDIIAGIEQYTAV